jgi:hypothetical protein
MLMLLGLHDATTIQTKSGIMQSTNASLFKENIHSSEASIRVQFSSLSIQHHHDDQSQQDLESIGTSAAVESGMQVDADVQHGPYKVPHATLVDGEIFKAELLPPLPFIKKYSKVLIASIILLFYN